MPRLSSLQPRSLRARFAIAFALLLALAALNMGAFHWGAYRRNRDFQDLHHAIAIHSMLNEIRADLDDQYKRVKVVSNLLGVERVALSGREYEQIVTDIRGLRDKLAPLVHHHESRLRKAPDHDDTLARVSARISALTDSWTTFYTRQLDNPRAALEEVVVRSEPLAAELLTQELPAAIAAENQSVERARDAFVATDEVSSRLNGSLA